jgi:hypothetical protein
MVNWVLIIWLVSSSNSLELINIERFDTEKSCIEKMIEIDMEPSWIASCVPEETNEDFHTGV